MFRVGLNPYGLSCTVGLQAHATPLFPEPLGIAGFLALAREIGAKCVELDGRWLTPLSAQDLARLGAGIAASGMTVICSDWLIQQKDETLEAAIRCAALVGAPTLRLHLTPVLEGARAHHGARWGEMVCHARATLKAEARRAADAGVMLAVENHQDFTSEELIAFAEEAGETVGLVLDTGNPFAVGEDPVAFARRAAHRIRHVHLKDYVAQFTTDGYRLVRCAIGDGCVPFQELEAVLPATSPPRLSRVHSRRATSGCSCPSGGAAIRRVKRASSRRRSGGSGKAGCPTMQTGERRGRDTRRGKPSCATSSISCTAASPICEPWDGCDRGVRSTAEAADPLDIASPRAEIERYGERRSPPRSEGGAQCVLGSRHSTHGC